MQELRGWIRFMLWPSIPYQLLEVVFPDRIETYYDGYDEIHVNATRNGYSITVIPRKSRSDSPGPITFISSHDPWSVGVLVTPFFLFRQLVITWAIIWFVIIYSIFFIGYNMLFIPPVKVISIAGREYMVVDPGWSPDPILTSYFILLLGFMIMYYVFHLLSFIKPTVKIATLVSIGAVSGVYYVVPAPEPLTVIKVNEFLKTLGYRFYNFQLDIVSTLVGTVTSLIRENKTLREQALSYDDALSRITQIDTMLKRFSAPQVVARFIATKPLLFIMMTMIPFIFGIIIGLMIGGGVEVVPPTANTAATP